MGYGYGYGKKTMPLYKKADAMDCWDKFAPLCMEDDCFEDWGQKVHPMPMTDCMDSIPIKEKECKEPMEHTCCMPHDMHKMLKMHEMHALPGLNLVSLAILNHPYFCIHAKHITEHSMLQISKMGTHEAFMEASLLGLLIGIGYTHEQAHMIIDSWQKMC